MDEAQGHTSNHFITVTYSDEHLPPDRSLRPKDITDFIKRVRVERPFRYFYCGEYGEQFKRPHYHIIAFGLRLDDLKWKKNAQNGSPLYTSAYLTKKWHNKGHIWIGAVERESAGYVARYCLKKVGGELALDHYQAPHLETGEYLSVEPEFARMSRRPGIGSVWYDKYKTDLYTYDHKIIEKGKSTKVPRYYDKLLEKENPDKLQGLKALRKEKALANECTAARLREKEEYKLESIKSLKRPI